MTLVGNSIRKWLTPSWRGARLSRHYSARWERRSRPRGNGRPQHEVATPPKPRHRCPATAIWPGFLGRGERRVEPTRSRRTRRQCPRLRPGQLRGRFGPAAGAAVGCAAARRRRGRQQREPELAPTHAAGHGRASTDDDAAHDIDTDALTGTYAKAYAAVVADDNADTITGADTDCDTGARADAESDADANS